MAITTRAAKGSPLTHTEVDTNFTDLRDNKTGYVTGDGGAITQSTSKSTGVTLSFKCGQITMNNAALAADTTVSFTLTNTTIEANDLLVLNHVGNGTAGAYLLNAQCAAGSASINVRNVTSGPLSEDIIIGFALVKAVV